VGPPAGHQALNPVNIDDIDTRSDDHTAISECGIRISE
jgi:hypothetical protein